jgi:hypothetical protein
MIKQSKVTPEVVYAIRDLMSASIPEFKTGFKKVLGMIGVEANEAMSDLEAKHLQEKMNDKILDMILEYKSKYSLLSN